MTTIYFISTSWFASWENYQITLKTLQQLVLWYEPVMESRPHNLREKPRQRPHHSRPDHSRPRPRPDHSRPRPLKSETQDRDPRPNIFLVKYFSTRKTSIFSLGIWEATGNLIYFSSFRSCVLDRVVSSETKTFEPRDRDETENFRETRPGLETSIHHWYEQHSL